MFSHGLMMISKTFHSSIMQHNIPVNLDARSYQQNLMKMHPSLEPSIKKELEKLLKAIIVFHVRHTHNGLPIWFLSARKGEKSDYVWLLEILIGNLKRITTLFHPWSTFHKRFQVRICFILLMDF